MNNGMWANPNFSMYAPFMPFAPYPTAPQGKHEGKHKKEAANSADAFYPSAGNEKEEKNSGFKNFLLGMKDGVVDTVKGIFTLKGAAITLGTVFAAWATGGAILIPLAIAGMGVGGYQIIKGIVNHDANKSGRGVDTFLLSLLGLKCAPSEFGGNVLKPDNFGGLWSKLKAPFRFDNQFVDPNRAVDFWKACWDSTKEVFQNLGKSLESKKGTTTSSTANPAPAPTVEPPPAPEPEGTNNGASTAKKPGKLSKLRNLFKRKPQKEEPVSSTEDPAPTPTVAGGSKKSTPSNSKPGSAKTSARSSQASTPQNPESNGGTEPETPKAKKPPTNPAGNEIDLDEVTRRLSPFSTQTTSEATTPNSSAETSPASTPQNPESNGGTEPIEEIEPDSETSSAFQTARTSRTSSRTSSAFQTARTSRTSSRTASAFQSARTSRTSTPDTISEATTPNSSARSSQAPTPQNPESNGGTDLTEESIRATQASTRYPSARSSQAPTPQNPESNGGTEPVGTDPQANQQQKTNPSFSRATWEYIKAKKGGHAQNALNGQYMGAVLSSPTVKSTEAQDETETEASTPGFPTFPYSPMFPPFP